jgi:transposase
MGNKKYDKEFKLEAISLAMEPGNSATKIERDLGIGQGVISRWKRQFKHEDEQAFPGKGHLKPDDEFVRKLKRDNERLRRERDILKKAVAIFSTDPHRYSGS